VQVIEYGKTNSRSSGAAQGDAEASAVKDQSAMTDISTSQKLVVRDGGVATITTHKSQPIPEPRAKDQADITTKLRFRDIGTTVKVRAEIVGTDGVVLDLEIRHTAIVGWAPTVPFPTPIIATRELTTSVRGKSGHTLVIGRRKANAKLTSSSTIPDGDTPSREDGPDPGQSQSGGSTKDKDSQFEIHITPRIVRDHGAPVIKGR
jgi:type II secretory pathway component HofQ